MDKPVDIWLLGNTGLRNPRRIAEGFALFASSPFVGKLYGAENEAGFMSFLNQHGIINNEPGKDSSASHARKWRLMFEKSGLIYRRLKSKEGIQEGYGSAGYITPFGYSFLQASTYAAQQECFLRAYSVEQMPTTDKTGLFSPLRWILAIMIELEKKTGSSEISRTEFALWGHTTDPTYDINFVVEKILDLRNRRNLAASKRVFDRHEKEARGEHYKHKPDNFFDYADMNMRYLRITGIIQRKGRGLVINPVKHELAEKMAKTTISNHTKYEEYLTLANGAPLPSDDMETALELLKSLRTMANEQKVFCDISDLKLDSAVNVNIARLRIEEALQQTSEIQFAERQRYEWQEIVEYMKLIEHGGGASKEEDEDLSVVVPKDETPAYLEWILWRAVLAIDHMLNKPYEVRGFKIDSDFLPVGTASGGKGDLYCDFANFALVTEVSMSISSRQEAMEGEPVRRHISDAIDKYEKPVYGLFVAVKIDTNTAETFRHGTWYDRDDNKRRLNILPLSLKQFREFFTAMFFYQKISPDYLRDLILTCSRHRDFMNGPDWKRYIDKTVFDTIDEFEYAHVDLTAKGDKKVSLYPGAVVNHPELGTGRVLAAVVTYDGDKGSNSILPFFSDLPDSVKLLPGGEGLQHKDKGHGHILGYQIAFGDQILYFNINDVDRQINVI